MTLNQITKARAGAAVFAAVVGLLGSAASGYAHDAKALEKPAHPMMTPAQGGGEPVRAMPGMPNMRVPSMDPAKGRKLYVEKGCVACHAINGVGGHDATPLDAHTMRPMMNPFEFAAKMWRMAPYMIAAQEEALGEQIMFTGDELSNIVAFVHDDEAQHDFTEADLTPQARRLMRHSHGTPGGGSKAHAEEIGHTHADGEKGTKHAD